MPGDKAFFYDDFTDMTGEDAPPREIAWERVVYTMKERKLERDVVS